MQPAAAVKGSPAVSFQVALMGDQGFSNKTPSITAIPDAIRAKIWQKVAENPFCIV
jgi:hypothetical protein